MGRRATIQTTFSKGELDPDLSDRQDLEHYYDSLASAPNSVFHPQGGFSDRGGFALASDQDVIDAGTKRRLRQRIVPLVLDADNLTAPNGGLTTNLVDQDATSLFTTNAVTSNTFVVVEIDLGTSQYVDMVDLIAFKSETGPADNCLSVQYWSGTSWVDFADPLDPAPAKHIRTTARTRRFATAPGGPGGVRVVARYWRIMCEGASGAVGQLSFGGLRLWQETGKLSEIDVREVARETGTTYELVITERNIDVFDRQRYVASIPTPIAGQQIDEMVYSGGFDTLLMFHEMIETQRIVRQGSPGEWDIGAAPYADVPDLSEQIVYSGSQDEIQRISFAGIEADDEIHLMLGDMLAPVITYTAAVDLPAQMITALNALPGVTGGHLLLTLVDGTPTVEVRFAGDNGDRAWPLLTALTVAPDVVPSTTVVQAGLNSSGKLFEDETGWPRCGAFVQQRIAIGGFRAAPTSMMFSRPGSWSYLDTADPMTADLAFIRTLNVDAIETITSIFVGRHLQVFTESGEWYALAQTLDATQPTAMVRATSHGIRRAVPIAFADGASVFVQVGGQVLRDFLWRDAEQSYAAEPLSVLSPQILSDVIDVAHRSARSVTDGNLIMLINADGTAGCLTLLRGQNVIAGSPWSTDGAFKAAMCDVRHDVYMVTERSGAHWLEKWTPDMPLDFATTVTGDGLTQVTGAHHLEGRDDVWAIADGEVLGPLTVASGVLTLPDGYAGDSITYGLLPAWHARCQVLRSRVTQEMPFRPPARIYEVEISVKDTGHLTLGTNGQAHADVPLLRLDEQFIDGGPLQTEDAGAPGLALFDRLYTGNVTMSGLVGFSRGPWVELGRRVPSPVHVKSLRMEFVMRAD